MLNAPVLDEMVNDICIIQCRIDTKSLCDIREIFVQMRVLSISHQFCGHDNLTTHQVSEFHEEAIGIAFEDFSAECLVGLFVTPLVSGDFGTNSLKVRSSVLLGQFPNISVRDFCGSFLKGGVKKSSVWIFLGSGVEAIRDEVLDGDLDRAHVALAGEVEVLVEKISVAIFFRGPPSRPAGPRGFSGTGGIVAALEGVEEGLVGGESFFRDHVADEDDEDFVRDAGCHFAEILDIFDPCIFGEVWEEVLWLP